MRKHIGFILVVVAAILLDGCFGQGGGSSAPPPTNVTVIPKDSRVVVTFDMISGVSYWIWKAAGVGVTPQNCSSMPSCSTTLNASSPTSVSGLTNGTLYSFSINGRTNGGPGGTGSPAVSATPRLAGTTWSTGPTTVTGTSNLRGVAYGTMFVAVGDGGASYSSTDGSTWAPLSTPAPGTSLNAVKYDNAHATYLSVGANGTVIALTPANTVWAAQTSYTANTLYALANNGAGYTVAVGDLGAIITSSDGATWTDRTSASGGATPITTNPLYGVTYGYSTTLAKYVFVAVGASGTLLYSADGINWTNVTPSPAPGYDLNGVTYGGLDANGHPIFVAVGTSGTVLTSEDGVNWTLQASTTIPAASNLTAIAYSPSRRFMAVAADGNIYYSEYYSSGSTTVGNGATTWTQVSSVPSSPLYAVTVGGLYDFSAVGASGTNLYAD